MKTKKLKVLVCIAVICGLFSVASASKGQVKDGQVWLGIGYAASKKGASAEAELALGALGILHSTVHSIAWGAAFGGPVGIAAGLVVSV